MKDYNKRLRPWLESWGAWRRLQLSIGYPKQSVSCNPDLHLALPIVEPPFRMPVLNYNSRQSSAENARRHFDAIRLAEKSLREYHHVKRTETKAKRVSSVPNYNPYWRMNYIDRSVQALPRLLRQVIQLRYESELKTHEIAYMIGRTISTVDKRLSFAHNQLQHIPTDMTADVPLKVTKRAFGFSKRN